MLTISRTFLSALSSHLNLLSRSLHRYSVLYQHQLIIPQETYALRKDIYYIGLFFIICSTCYVTMIFSQFTLHLTKMIFFSFVLFCSCACVVSLVLQLILRYFFALGPQLHKCILPFYYMFLLWKKETETSFKCILATKSCIYTKYFITFCKMLKLNFSEPCYFRCFRYHFHFFHSSARAEDNSTFISPQTTFGPFSSPYHACPT